MDSLSIRKLRIEDSAAVVSLCSQLGYPSSPADIRKRLIEINQHSENCAFAAVIEERVVGWIHAFYTVRIESAACIEIGGLVIDRDYRSMHIGKELVGEVSSWALRKNVRIIKVRSNVIRSGAHEFYKRIGFIETKEQKVFTFES